MNIGTSLKTISKNQLCSFIGTGGYVELAETDVLSDGSIITSAAVLPLLNSRNDKGEGILPPGYQRVEFLASSGTQYIDTGISPANNIGVRLLAGNTESVRDAFPAGVNDATLSTREAFYLSRCIRGYAYAGRWGSTFWWTKYPQSVVPGTFISELNWLNSREMRVDNNGIISSYSPLSTFNYVTKKTIYLFDINGTENIGWRDRIYYCQISQEADIIQDLVPVIDTNGTPCMFDTVTKQPFYNEGTGQFRVGIATLQQVRELQLPDNTGNAVRTLYVSLPQEARTDFTAQKNLSYLTDSLNWIIDIQYRDGDIPADYTKADFLQSSGSQYIDTGVVTDGHYTIACRMQISYGTAWGRAQDTEEGAFQKPTSWARYLGGTYAGLYFIYRRQEAVFNVPTDSSPSWDLTEPHDWVAEEGSAYVTLDGQRVLTRNMGGGDLEADNPWELSHYIFWANGYYTHGNGKAGMKLYKFTMIDRSGSTVLDLVPVINTAGVPGMWDKVGKKFYKNDGDGAFIVGIKTINDARMLNNALPVVPDGSTYSITLSLPGEASTDAPAQKALKDLADRGWNITVRYREDEIPAGYAKVAFLESSGSQYIDTQVMPLPDTRLHVEAEMQTTSQYRNLFGVRNYDTSGNGKLFDLVMFNSSDRNARFDVYYTGPVATLPETRFSIDYTGSEILLNGARVSSYTPSALEFTTENTLCLMAMNYGNTVNQWMSGKIYSFKLASPETPLLDLVPVINTAGVPGMWDKVNKQFFKNDGTGQFRVGLASKEAVRNLYLEPNVAAGTTIDLSVPAGTTNEDTDILKANNPNYTFNIQYRS